MNEEARGERGSRGREQKRERGEGGVRGDKRKKGGRKWKEGGSMMVGNRARERKNFNQISITSIPLFWRFSNSISCVRE